jgi:hypothetical protein
MKGVIRKSSDLTIPCISAGDLSDFDRMQVAESDQGWYYPDAYPQ